MDPNIKGTPDYGISYTPVSDIKKKGKFSQFKLPKDSISGAEGFSKKSTIEADIPVLSPVDLHSGSLLEISSTKFAYLVIQPILLEIELFADDLINKLGEPNKTNMILLDLLKKISEAIKNLEKQIEEARGIDAKTIRKMLNNIIDKAKAILDELKEVREKIKELNEEMNGMEKSSKKAKGIRGFFDSVKTGFKNLKERFSKENRQARRAGRKANRKARRAGRKANRKARRSGRKAKRAARKTMSGKERRADRKKSRQGRRAVRKERRGARRARRQERRQAVRDAGGPFKLIFSTVKGVIVDIFQGKGVGEIVNNLVNRIRDLFKLFFGIGLSVQELRSYSLISLMTISSIHLELSRGAENVEGLSEEEQEKLDAENKERVREELKLIIGSYTSDEEIREVMGDDACSQLESDEFIDALIQVAESQTGVVGEVSDESIMKFINAILEENENYIGSLLKDLKLLKKLYSMILAMLNGQVGGDFSQMAKDLKKILGEGESTAIYMAQQA